MAFLSQTALEHLGFKNIGANVLVSEKVSFYGTEYISLGDNTRIDDFCILSAGPNGISIGAYVHIACYACIIGRGAVVIEDFANISGRVSIYSSSDDFLGNAMTNPTVDPKYTNVTDAPVIIRKHVIIGAGSVVLPGITLNEGAAIGALSLINKDCDCFTVYAGNPIRMIKQRKRDLLYKELAFLKENGS